MIGMDLNNNSAKIYNYDMCREEILVIMKEEKNRLIKESTNQDSFVNHAKREVNHMIAEFLANKIFLMEKDIEKRSNENYDSFKKELNKYCESSRNRY
jgi:hypothetical protein